MRHVLVCLALLASLLGVTACTDADVASRNLSKAADNFEVPRRIVFYNGITGEYMLVIEGACSLDIDQARSVKVTCKVGPSEYKKHYLGLSDNVTYFAEQLNGVGVSAAHYRVTFKPSVILPDIDIR